MVKIKWVELSLENKYCVKALDHPSMAIEFFSSICYNVLAHTDNQKYGGVLLHIIYTQIQEAFCRIKEV